MKAGFHKRFDRAWVVVAVFTVNQGKVKTGISQDMDGRWFTEFNQERPKHWPVAGDGVAKSMGGRMHVMQGSSCWL